MSRAAPISAGEFDQRATVERRNAGRDDVGQIVETWAPVGGERWARYRPATGREYIAAGGAKLEANGVFAFRFDPALELPDVALRVVWRGAVYPAVAPPVDVDAGRHTIELVCTSGFRP